jgi:isopentenyl-diphosphate delta-isomerase
MISSRKEEHVRLALEADVGFRSKTTGLDDVELPYNALPEINLTDIRTPIRFFTRTLSYPLLISGMTGGYPNAEYINGALAETAADLGLGMGVGSMRAAVEDPSQRSTFTVVRQYSNHVPIISNIGGVQLAQWYRHGALTEIVHTIVEMVGASVFGIHLNPLQEVLQPEGQPEFRGVLEAIQATVTCSPVPVLVKEVGAGISAAVAHRLIGAGVHAIDVAGAGGTSWAGVEILRHDQTDSMEQFWDVGIRTSDCLKAIAALRKAYQEPTAASGITFPTVIASGGIQNGSHVAKAIALGANLCASARPLLQALERGGTSELKKTIGLWERDTIRWMFLSGCSTLHDLQTCLEEPS